MKKIKGHSGTRHALKLEVSSNHFEIPKKLIVFIIMVCHESILVKVSNLLLMTKKIILAFYHLKDKLIAIMWHPEREIKPHKSICKLIKNHFVNMINCLILAAGEGKRLRPFTNDYPKGLVSLLGKPLVSYQIDNLNSLNIKNIAIVTGYKSEKFSNLNCQTFKK